MATYRRYRSRSAHSGKEFGRRSQPPNCNGSVQALAASTVSLGPGGCDSQATKQEDKGDGKLPFHLHLQTPQPRHRQNQDGDIGQDVWRRGDVMTNFLKVETFARRARWVPGALERTAGEEGGDYKGDEPSQGDYGDDNAPDGEFGNGEDAMVEIEDGEFERERCDWKCECYGEEALDHVRG